MDYWEGERIRMILLKPLFKGLSNPTTIKIKPNGEVSPIYLPNKEGRVLNRFRAWSAKFELTVA